MQMKKSAAGALLKMERLRQERTQREVCYGICTVSYLSKIENLSASPDADILVKLFDRLGVVYEADPERLQKIEAMVEEYYRRLLYRLDRTELVRQLCADRKSMLYSPYAIDLTLIELMEDVSIYDDAPPRKRMDGRSEAVTLLEQVSAAMDDVQTAYFQIVLSTREEHAAERVRLAQRAFSVLNNTFAYACLLDAWFADNRFAAIHQAEGSFTAMALAEGNTCALAEYFYLNGIAYGSFDMGEMMINCFARASNLLQNTGWEARYREDILYNSGAVYLQSGDYVSAKACLEQIREKGFLVQHKLAMAYLRMGEVEKYAACLVEMKRWLDEHPTRREADALMYEELKMEGESGFLRDPEYIRLLEKLFAALRRERHAGFLYQYREVALAAYAEQRQYKKALRLEAEISSNLKN